MDRLFELWNTLWIHKISFPREKSLWLGKILCGLHKIFFPREKYFVAGNSTCGVRGRRKLWRSRDVHTPHRVSPSRRMLDWKLANTRWAPRTTYLEAVVITPTRPSGACLNLFARHVQMGFICPADSVWTPSEATRRALCKRPELVGRPSDVVSEAINTLS